MFMTANGFADHLNPKFGIPAIKPVVGESFDRNNDLFLVDEHTVLHRDGHVTRSTSASVIHDALIEYNRRHMAPIAFAHNYADDPTETRA